MILIFCTHTEDLFQLLCTKREHIHGDFQLVHHANLKFRRFEGGLCDDRNRKTKNRND